MPAVLLSGMASRRLRDRDYERIVRRYMKGEAQRDIAEEYGITQGYVSQIVAAYSGTSEGEKRARSNRAARRHRLIPASDYPVICKRIDRGELQSSIAAEYGVNPSRISRLYAANRGGAA